MSPLKGLEHWHDQRVIDGFTHQLPDGDPEETKEWMDSFDAVVDRAGRSRARFMLAKLMERAGELNVGNAPPTWTPYVLSLIHI